MKAAGNVENCKRITQCGCSVDEGDCRGLFFFQAEDGIRYHCVTGVQTCALPICTTNATTTRINNLISIATSADSMSLREHRNRPSIATTPSELLWWLCEPVTRHLVDRKSVV